MTVLSQDAGRASTLDAPGTIVQSGGSDVVTSVEPRRASIRISYQPILDVARGVAAGYQVVLGAPPDADRVEVAVLAARSALEAHPTLPTNTFISVPLPLDLLGHAAVSAALMSTGDLRGVVLDICDFATGPLESVAEALETYRDAGAMLAVGGRGAAQPELTSIVRLKPAIIRLGRAWVRGVDRSEAKRSAVEVTGRLASQLDAWILAEGVGTSAELRALAGLTVPLAQGPFIGEPQEYWPEIDLGVRTVLPPAPAPTDGVLRQLLQQSYTTKDLDAARSVLPETTGFDVVVVLDEHRRPTSVLERTGDGRWATGAVLAVNIDTPVADAVERAMARPRDLRFTPLACTDNAGRFLGVLRIERLMSHLTSAPRT